MNDPYLWLEEIEGERALNWVREQNYRSLQSLRSDPRHDTLFDAALELATAEDRIPFGSVRDGHVYNFWQDEKNVRGLWRRTSLEQYRADTPEWEVLLDVDALASDEGANWVFKGANCFRPKAGGDWRCMVSLSNGGKDAVETREFDLASADFVEGGFATPEAKQGQSWLGPDTLLIATDWGGDGSTLTESGYPRTVKRWQRGTPLSEAAPLFTGDVADVGVWPWVIELEDGTRLAGAVEADTFFTSTFWYFPETGAPRAWPLPPKSEPQGVRDGRLLVKLAQDWTPQGQAQAFLSGDLVAVPVEPFLRDGRLGQVELVFRPDASQAVNGVAVSSEAALLSINEDVVGRILSLSRDEDGWRAAPVPMPGQGQASIAFANPRETTVFLTYEGFLTPDTLLEYDGQSVQPLKRLPARFDTDALAVEQHFATSADGTEIPYFVVRRRDAPMDGTTPTLLYAYGGFEVSRLPSYSGALGRLWLERGGAYVLANIRGGGEYGPSWHQAGLKTNRQRIYDDFIAVGEDLVARGLTSPDRLGIMGGSNGGLLMGVMLNQRPDLWNAVVVQVPLLDMLRYHLLLAGASWVDEYGSPEVPEERAFLETISPYHNFDPDKPYPAPFFVTSTKDDRVHPGHARKMAKRFEAAGLPFYYYENIDGGHSAAANQTETAKRLALEFTYLSKRLMDAPPAGGSPEGGSAPE